MHQPRALINLLRLQPHPEGGWFRETYRSDLRVPAPLQREERSTATHIYHLLTSESFSAFHRLTSDEIWNLHEGGPLTVFTIDPAGLLTRNVMGANLAAGATYQLIIPHGTWFAARLEIPGTYALIGCTVAPGFEYKDFELARRDDLLNLFPQHASIIRELTRQ